MKITKKDLQDGTCNFCSRGTLKENGQGIDRPYNYVFQVSRDGSGISVRFCQQCFDELKESKP